MSNGNLTLRYVVPFIISHYKRIKPLNLCKEVVWKIGGAGVAGSYLYGRMKSAGFDVEIYDPKVEDFYIPCGFGTNRFKIEPFLRNLSIDFNEIVETPKAKVIVSGNNFAETEFKWNGLCTVDKMKMEKMMRGNMSYIRSIIKPDKDPIIDCTGISRAYLGKSSGDVTMYGLEKVCERSPFEGFYFNFFKGGRGYFWSFPVGKRYHIGAGGIDLSEVRNHIEPYECTRIVSRKIRMGPSADGIVKGNVFGVGESIGYISPLLGEGIVPAMENAEKFFQIIKKNDDIEEISLIYQRSIARDLERFSKISKLVQNIQNGKAINFENISVLRKALNEVNNFGMKPDFLKIIRHFL